jgi:hypothetical protein
VRLEETGGLGDRDLLDVGHAGCRVSGVGAWSECTGSGATWRAAQ